MKSTKTILLVLACISFITVIGGAVYEHLAVVPKWKQAPPASLTMFQGEYGLDPGDFWQKIHPVTLVLLIAALLANWKTGRRKFILISIAGYILALILTFVYFVPELLSIIQAPFALVADKSMIARANMWEILSLVRLVFILVLAAILLFSLTKGNENRKTQQ
ncbi:MAG: hypothetical protein H7Y01_12290 [Ferruginibacter sp.]|nr:hypothetical protein [Chitinophagaceae bacterium]